MEFYKKVHSSFLIKHIRQTHESYPFGSFEFHSWIQAYPTSETPVKVVRK